MTPTDGHVCCAAVADLPADARALFESAGHEDIQASLPWFENYLAGVDLAGARPAFHLWRAGGRVLAMLPLQVAGGCVSALGNYYTTRWAPLLAAGLDDGSAGDALAKLLRAVLQMHRPHTLTMGPLQAGTRVERELARALRINGCAVWPIHAFQNWTLAVNPQSSTAWPDYLAARDGKLRTTISRMGRRFAARGGRLELIQGGPGLEAGIAAYEAVYAASWKQPEPHPAFMPGLIRAAAAAGQLRLALAWLGERPVAAQVWMVAGGRADIYKLAHDEAHKETSPGTLLTTLLMQHVFEVDRVAVVDYLSGDDDYKRLWMSQVCEYRQLLACRLAHPLGAARAIRHGLRLAARHTLHALRSSGTANTVNTAGGVNARGPGHAGSPHRR